jgi:hypothetical protein
VIAERKAQMMSDRMMSNKISGSEDEIAGEL